MWDDDVWDGDGLLVWDFILFVTKIITAISSICHNIGNVSPMISIGENTYTMIQMMASLIRVVVLRSNNVWYKKMISFFITRIIARRRFMRYDAM